MLCVDRARRHDMMWHCCSLCCTGYSNLSFPFKYCPKAYFPPLPNVTRLEWSRLSSSSLEGSGILLLGYALFHALDSLLLSSTGHARQSPRPLSECHFFLRHRRLPARIRTTQEVGRIVAQWPRLRTLRTSATAQRSNRPVIIPSNS